MMNRVIQKRVGKLRFLTWNEAVKALAGVCVAVSARDEPKSKRESALRGSSAADLNGKLREKGS
jgi:hypothetical protein